MSDVLERFQELFGPQALADLVLGFVPDLLVALAVLAVFGLLAAGVRRVLAAVFSRVHFDTTAAAFVQTVVRTTLWVVGLLTALNQVGVNITSILASLGILGLTVGFAAQNTLSNVISGLFIFWDRPFVIGDLIEVDGQYGRVERITMRSTRVVTPQGKMLAIPNNVIANATVASYTNFPHLRLDLPVTIGVDEPVGKTRDLLLSLVTDDRFLSDPAPAVVVTDLGDYNVTVELRVWIRDETAHIALRHVLLEAMKDVLDENGVVMPYETLSVAMKSA